MKKLITVFIVFSAILSVNAQSLKLKRADKQYNHLAYKAAGEQYERLRGSKHSSPVMLSNLAMCYYNTNQMQKAVEVYESYLKLESASADELFYYSQALKQSGKIAEGDEQLKLLYAKSGSDLRAKSLIENINYLDEIKSKGDVYSIKNLSINTPNSDFGGYEYFNEILFLSSKYESLSVKREWSWDGTTFLDVYAATEKEGDLIEVGKFDKICTKYHEGPLCFDGGTGLYFTRNNSGKTKYDKNGIQNLSMFFGSVDKLGGVSETLMPFCSSEYSVGHPAISPDGKTLYFASDMPGSKGVDIYQVSIDGHGVFGTPQRLAGAVNTDGDEMFPFISVNGELYFSSNGHIGLGGLDVFCLNSNGEVRNLGTPINSTRDDFAFVLKKDRVSGYFSSNRDGGKGDDDIYSFSFLGPIDILLSGTITDKKSSVALAGVTVVLLDAMGKEIASVQTDKDGKYSAPVLSGTTYTMQVLKNGYSSETASIVTQRENLVQDFEMKKSGVEFIFSVSDDKDKSPLEGVAIKLVEKANQNNTNLRTSELGSVSKPMEKYKVGDKVEIELTLSKAGYLVKKSVLNFTILSEIVNISEFMDLSLHKLSVGEDLTELIQINPIYFDLGKYAIRKDAAVELDKIVSIMNEYPEMRIELGSHTDCRASASFNKQLSNKRAVASADYIKKKISNPNRISGVGYGESKLKVDCPCEGAVKSTCSEEEHQKNRRTEFIIVSVD
jgi:outer membrane protein OmpA-like peptidoglycan-associated protein